MCLCVCVWLQCGVIDVQNVTQCCWVDVAAITPLNWICTDCVIGGLKRNVARRVKKSIRCVYGRHMTFKSSLSENIS